MRGLHGDPDRMVARFPKNSVSDGGNRLMKHRRPVFGAATLGLLLATASPAVAEWKLDGQAILFYTDDIGLFSATRRLSRDSDPTQPAIDSQLTNKGSAVVFEPELSVSKAFMNRYGTTTVDIKGQGFIFADNARFNQSSLRVQALHQFNTETRIRVRYYYAPNQFLGDNEEHQTGTDQIVPEKLTSHIWSARIERTLTPDVEVRLLGRYGMRRYNQSFSERDTDFWTIGPHVDWKITRRIKLGLSYHYERGLADGRNEPQFKDDVSYINHYMSADLDFELMERLTLFTAFHYELNIWTSDIAGDERNGAHENVYQGEAILAYRVTDSMRAFAGVQRSNRKQSFETEGAKNTNVGIGLNFAF
jgi:hypothetical protein